MNIRIHKNKPNTVIFPYLDKDTQTTFWTIFPSPELAAEYVDFKRKQQMILNVVGPEMMEKIADF